MLNLATTDNDFTSLSKSHEGATWCPNVHFYYAILKTIKNIHFRQGTNTFKSSFSNTQGRAVT